MDTAPALTTTDAAPAFSGLSLTPSETSVLNRAFDPGAIFTAAEIALIEPIARAVTVARPADERTIRRSLGALAAALPAQHRDDVGSKLQLNTYTAMLAGCDERALANACRRCLDELDWLPTIHQLKERMHDWVSPEAAAISRARLILRAGRRVTEGQDGEPVEVGDVEALHARLASALVERRHRPKAVAYDDPAPLLPDQIRVPNKDDYARLFGIDAQAIEARAAAARQREEEWDRDLLVDALHLHEDLYRTAAAA